MIPQYAVKVLVTASVVVAVSEIAKRSSFWGALLASLPLTSVLAFVWLFIETGDTERVSALSRGILWLLLASLPLFILLPSLLRAGWSFWLALGVACGITAGAYVGLAWALSRFGVQL
jgi:hypothetical protein